MKESKIGLEKSLVIGSEYILTDDPKEVSKPLVVRGVIKKDHVESCIRNNRDFYYIDTGYFGNFPSPANPGGKKIFHRVVKNENQHSTIKDVPDDRWKKIQEQDPKLKWQGWKNYDKKILLVMPNPKACKYYNHNYDTWVDNTKKQISEIIDLPIEVRIKGSRTYRNREYSIYDAFDSGVYATVAFNSIAAVESVLYGIPAFVSVPCAASPISSMNLKNLNNPFKPDLETINKQAANLAYGQFTLDEITSGTAWKMINRYETSS